MNVQSIASILALLALGAPIRAQSAGGPPIAPAEAVQLAAAAAPDQGVQGSFLVTVKASGEDKRRKRIYLNSELDYRDQRNLTVEIEQSAISGLEAKYGKDLKTYFIGKQILVAGTARRVTIYFGKPRVSAVSGNLRNKYYFQTHLPVVSADQIVLAPSTSAVDEGFLTSEFPNLPGDAARVVERLAACNHFAGEHTGGASAVRDQEVAVAVSKLGCDMVERDAEVIRRTYATDESVQAALAAASKF
jgi:hypothetical protein